TDLWRRVPKVGLAGRRRLEREVRCAAPNRKRRRLSAVGLAWPLPGSVLLDRVFDRHGGGHLLTPLARGSLAVARAATAVARAARPIAGPVARPIDLARAGAVAPPACLTVAAVAAI